MGSALFCGLLIKQKAVATVHLADQEGWLARFEIGQELRSDARQTVLELAGQGIDLAIFSGDGQASTEFIAGQLGIAQARGQMQPADKLTALKTLHDQGHCVAVVGDGINDALVLAAADVSVSLGSAVAIAQNQCDILLQNGQLHDLVRARRQALATMAVIRQNLAWALVYNLVSVPLAVMGWLPAWLAGLGMALSSLLVIANASRLARSFGRTGGG
jgi:Cu2+-exporting ATPase